jgi:HSP20 family protein
MRPLRHLYNLQRTLNHAFDDVQENDDELECRGAWIPNVDIKETSDDILLYAELPGLQKENIKITVRDKVLSISGDKVQPDAEKNETFHRLERVYGNFCRQFALPALVETAKISAVFVDGVLKLTLPKQQQAKAQEIKIVTK